MTRKPRKSAKKPAAGSTEAAPIPVAEPAMETPSLEPAPIIRIEIDPGVSGGFLHGRFDVHIRGRVVSQSPAEEITLLLDGEAVCAAQYGDPDKAATATLPDGTHAKQRAFHFTLAYLNNRADGPCHAVISARTADGQVYEEPFELAIDPQGPEPVVLVAGPTQSAATGPGVRPPVVVYVERATLDDDGQLQLQGWSIALTTLVTVQVFADEERISAARLGGARDDVASVYPAYPNARTSGFSLTVPLGENLRHARAIRAQAIGSAGVMMAKVIW